jgi:rhodanese-related sulfurtransferase
MAKQFAVWKFIQNAARAVFRSDIPRITEASTLREVLNSYPEARDCLRRRFHFTLTPEDLGRTLREVCDRYGLPPAQIVFMEIQLSIKNRRIQQVPAPVAKSLLDGDPAFLILDVREPQEWCHHPGIVGAQKCEEAVLKDVVLGRSPTTPLLLYCHFGVRSLDFAHWLADQGFTSIFVVQGGLDAWSIQVDSSIPRYDGAYC